MVIPTLSTFPWQPESSNSLLSLPKDTTRGCPHIPLVTMATKLKQRPYFTLWNTIPLRPYLTLRVTMATKIEQWPYSVLQNNPRGLTPSSPSYNHNNQDETPTLSPFSYSTWFSNHGNQRLGPTPKLINSPSHHLLIWSRFNPTVQLKHSSHLSWASKVLQLSK